MQRSLEVGMGQGLAIMMLGLASITVQPDQASAQLPGIFMKIEGVEGESRAEGHENEIDVLSWSWGTAGGRQVAALRTAVPGAAPPASVTDLVVTKGMDKATPTLMKACAMGDPIGTVVIAARQTDGSYLRYELKNAIITSYSLSGPGRGRQTKPLESISLNFEKIVFHPATTPKPEAVVPARD